MKKLLIILIIAVTGCVDFDHEGQLYLILKGKHKSNSPIAFISSNQLHFEGMFDESAIYDLGNKDQLDINKLIGFSFGLESHHKNSARIGWRWSIEKNKVELFAYYYLSSERFYEHICDVNINQVFSGQISLSDSTINFSIDHYHLEVESSIAVKYGSQKYILHPYFGGNQKAPHNITIALNINE